MAEYRKKYRHIFFDLDKTLWDFERNSLELLNELFVKYELKDAGIPDFSTFHSTYHRINLELWEQYRMGKLEKKEVSYRRFYNTIRAFGLDLPDVSRRIAFDYVELSPLKTGLIPGSKEALDYLFSSYKLHIITNGFSEVQSRKIEINGLSKYFVHVITSEEAGIMKPDPEVFRYAMKMAGAQAEDSLMIGDDIEVDMLGAMSAGMDQLFLNLHQLRHPHRFTFEINTFDEVYSIL